ncbi:MAG TPA: polyprenyl diphosphate synthase [Steroidobacteraceae bacterium]|nr:polyprenyl diphosphate synthase [Steroidobacteraceae bacterium]
MTLPRHIAIVMDGNGRWAAARGQPRVAGHKSGLEAVRVTVRECVKRKIEALTLFAFSSENWQRPPEEVSSLMSLFFEALERELAELHENGVRLRFIGDRKALSVRLQARIAAAEQQTAGNGGLQLQVAVSYGGRWDVVQAARKLAKRCAQGALRAEDITERDLAAAMELAVLDEGAGAREPLADPDLFIRTGGEKRISNFLLWNLAYTELYFTDTLWPDFDAAELDAALAYFASRERRFGLTSAQMQRAGRR